MATAEIDPKVTQEVPQTDAAMPELYFIKGRFESQADQTQNRPGRDQETTLINVRVPVNTSYEVSIRRMAPHGRADFEAYIDSKIDEFKTLKPGWAGEGAEAIAPHTADLARSFILSAFGGGDFREPYLVPGADGTIQFEWYDGARSLEFEVLPDGTVEFLMYDPEAPSHMEGGFPVTAVKEARRLITSFFQ